MSDERLKQAMIPLVTISLEGKIKSVNNRFINLVGYPIEELIGSHIEKVMDSGVRFFFNSMLYPKLMMEKEIQEVYLSLKTKNQDVRPVMFNAEVVESEEAIYCYIVPVAQRAEYTKEIRTINKKLEETVKEKTRLHEELLTMNKRLKYHAERDSLTSLYNRRMFLKKLTRLHEQFEKVNQVFSICILDVDHFKQVNDRYGHLTGDQVLIGLANEMTDFFDSECTLARFGGEEFIILFPGYNHQDAYKLANQFCKHVKQQSWDGVAITISMGISEAAPSRSVTDIVAGADMALYKAKNMGRDRVICEEEIASESYSLTESSRK